MGRTKSLKVCLGKYQRLKLDMVDKVKESKETSELLHKKGFEGNKKIR